MTLAMRCGIKALHWSVSVPFDILVSFYYVLNRTKEKYSLLNDVAILTNINAANKVSDSSCKVA